MVSHAKACCHCAYDFGSFHRKRSTVSTHFLTTIILKHINRSQVLTVSKPPDPFSGGAMAECCQRCCGFIITSGLAALFLWLSLRTSAPTCSIQDFYVPALNISGNFSGNHSLYFDLKLDNQMKDKSVHYANITLTFFYNNATPHLPIANFTVPEFKQGHKKNTRRKALVEAAGVPWSAAIGAVSNGSSSTVSFSVRLVTRVKYKIVFWYTKRHSLAVAGDVEVNGSGKKVKKKGIKMKKSGAPGPNGDRVGVVGPMVAAFALLFFTLF
ncbi:protein NDR1-like [Andrographis paniculata]|uniref:protein NDR1-like n=1 Tax=Andrographis paniculata TaxID=175694 RepID=UPI0021E8A6EB|nr:protein NDR1-like [Andrographis paniculata]